jgi:hypothetical protein
MIYINKMSKCTWELVQLSFCLSACLSVYPLSVRFNISPAFPFPYVKWEQYRGQIPVSYYYLK